MRRIAILGYVHCWFDGAAWPNPCAVDNLHQLRDAFQNEQGYVPAYYLI